jgi:group I intron endonuclease
MKKFNVVYKTTNQINGKFYIGKHSTDIIDDGYLGSGRLLVAAIKKYGDNNFTRQVLFIFETTAEMEIKERELVTELLVSDPHCYNIALGGQGGNLGPVVNKKIGIAMSAVLKGRPKSESHKASIGRANEGKVMSTEVKQKISNTVKKNQQCLTESQRKEKFGHPAEKNGFYGKQHSAGTIDKIKTTIGDSRKGSNNPNAKSVTINGITYLTHKECRESLSISKRQLYKILGE